MKLLLRTKEGNTKETNDKFQENERRDDYMEMREGLDLTNVNFREYVIAHGDTKEPPWYTRPVVFWIASVLLLSWPLRLIIEYNTAYVHYQVSKNILKVSFLAILVLDWFRSKT